MSHLLRSLVFVTTVSHMALARADDNPFVGNWIYRSFINDPKATDNFNDIRLWQADLTLKADQDGTLSGELAADNYHLKVSGSCDLRKSPATIRLWALGVDGTETQGWRYDYEGVASHRWTTGDAQRPVITGSVIRTLPHAPNRDAGLVYAFVAVSKDFPSAPSTLPEKVTGYFAERVHRLHHVVWHGIRNYWNDLKESERYEIVELGWRINGDRAALVSDAERTRPLIGNASGEDFLFFHRQMVRKYRQLSADAGVTPIRWREIPQPGSLSKDFPTVVPAAWAISDYPFLERRFKSLKTDGFFWSRMRWWDSEYKNQKYLATLTLGELGSLIEFSVHNDMHMRWSELARDPLTNAPLVLGRPEYDFSPKWDKPKYNWLGEFYSSHVNPAFWGLHGWIDDRIDDWYRAHESAHPGEVKQSKLGGVPWFTTGKWVRAETPWVWPKDLGGVASDPHDPALDEKRLKSLEAVVRVLFPPPTREIKTFLDTHPAETHALRGRSGRNSLVGGLE